MHCEWLEKEPEFDFTFLVYLDRAACGAFIENGSQLSIIQIFSKLFIFN